MLYSIQMYNLSVDTTHNFMNNHISFFHRRWFWGIILGIVAVLAIWLRPSHDCLSATFASEFLDFFSLTTMGFVLSILVLIAITTLGTLDVSMNKINHILSRIGAVVGERDLSIFLAIGVLAFWLCLLLLIYKTFRRQKVKIRYPILFIIILLLSLFFGHMSLFYVQC